MYVCVVNIHTNYPPTSQPSSARNYCRSRNRSFSSSSLLSLVSSFFLVAVRFFDNQSHPQSSSAWTKSNIKYPATLLRYIWVFQERVGKSQTMDFRNSSQNREAVKTERDSRSHTNLWILVRLLPKRKTRIWIESIQSQLVKTERNTAIIALPHVPQDRRYHIVGEYEGPRSATKSNEKTRQTNHTQLNSAQFRSNQECSAI